jgi:hypothetical protein
MSRGAVVVVFAARIEVVEATVGTGSVSPSSEVQLGRSANAAAAKRRELPAWKERLSADVFIGA